MLRTTTTTTTSLRWASSIVVALLLSSGLCEASSQHDGEVSKTTKKPLSPLRRAQVSNLRRSRNGGVASNAKKRSLSEVTTRSLNSANTYSYWMFLAANSDVTQTYENIKYWDVYEIEAYASSDCSGSKITTTPPPTFESSGSYSSWYLPEYAFDGNEESFWSGYDAMNENSDGPIWVQMELPQEVTINCWKLNQRTEYPTTKVSVYGAKNNADAWTFLDTFNVDVKPEPITLELPTPTTSSPTSSPISMPSLQEQKDDIITSVKYSVRVYQFKDADTFDEAQGEYIFTDPTDRDAFALKVETDKCFLAFRGTKPPGVADGFELDDLAGNVKDILDNIPTAKTDISSIDNPDTKCKVTENYFNGYERLRTEVETKVDQQCQGKDLIITGHSQGTSMAQLAAVRFEARNPQLYLFAPAPTFFGSCSAVPDHRILNFVNTEFDNGLFGTGIGNSFQYDIVSFVDVFLAQIKLADVGGVVGQALINVFGDTFISDVIRSIANGSLNEIIKNLASGELVGSYKGRVVVLNPDSSATSAKVVETRDSLINEDTRVDVIDLSEILTSNGDIFKLAVSTHNPNEYQEKVLGLLNADDPDSFSGFAKGSYCPVGDTTLCQGSCKEGKFFGSNVLGSGLLGARCDEVVSTKSLICKAVDDLAVDEDGVVEMVDIISSILLIAETMAKKFVRKLVEFAENFNSKMVEFINKNNLSDAVDFAQDVFVEIADEFKDILKAMFEGFVSSLDDSINDVWENISNTFKQLFDRLSFSWPFGGSVSGNDGSGDGHRRFLQVAEINVPRLLDHSDGGEDYSSLEDIFDFTQLKSAIADSVTQIEEAARDISLEMFGIVDCFSDLLHPDSTSNVRRHLVPDPLGITQVDPLQIDDKGVVRVVSQYRSVNNLKLAQFALTDGYEAFYAFGKFSLEATRTGVETANELIDDTCKALPNLGVPMPLLEMEEMCQFVAFSAKATLHVVEDLLKFGAEFPDALGKWVSVAVGSQVTLVDRYNGLVDAQMNFVGGYLSYMMGTLPADATDEQKRAMAISVLEARGQAYVSV